jgi:transposase-like protein
MVLRLPRDRSIRAGHRRIRLTTPGRRRRSEFFQRAIGTTKVAPAEVTTDQARLYPAVLDELLPAARHRSDRYANNRVECDHGRAESAGATDARAQAGP